MKLSIKMLLLGLFVSNACLNVYGAKVKDESPFEIKGAIQSMERSLLGKAYFYDDWLNRFLKTTDSDGNNWFHRQIINGNAGKIRPDRIEALKQRLAIMKSVGQGGNTVLHLLAKYGQYDVMDGLGPVSIELVLQKNDDGQTPIDLALLYAGVKGTVEDHKKIVDDFVDFLKRYKGSEFKDEIKEELAKVSSKDETEAPEEDEDKAEQVSLDQLLEEDGDGENAFFNWARNGDHEVINEDYLKNLDESDLKKVLSARTKKGDTLMHYACTYGNKGIAELLDELDSTLIYKQNASENYPIHNAALTGKLALINWIIGKDADLALKKGENRNNFMHLLARNGYAFIVGFYYDKYQDLLKQPNDNGNTPLMLALREGKRNVAETLFKKDKTLFYAHNYNNVQSKKQNHNTGLHLLVGNHDNAGETEKLLKLFFDEDKAFLKKLLSARNRPRNNERPLDYAVRCAFQNKDWNDRGMLSVLKALVTYHEKLELSTKYEGKTGGGLFMKPKKKELWDTKQLKKIKAMK